MTFALIFFQLTHGASLAPEPHLFEPPYVGEIFKDLLLATHLLGISVNALLCKFYTQLISRKKNSNTIYLFFSVFGMYWGKRRLMLPWLFLQGLLASILASLACYYIALFPLKTSCLSDKTTSPSSKIEANFRPIVSSTIKLLPSSEEESDSASCQVLLWYGAIMILSILILIYYFYIVNVSMSTVLVRLIEKCNFLIQ